MSKNRIPDEGYLRLNQIIGQVEVTVEEAARNRKNSSAISFVGRSKSFPPKSPRREIPPIIPVSRSTWWAGVKSGLFPKPVKLGPRTTAWRVEDIRALIQRREIGGVYAEEN